MKLEFEPNHLTIDFGEQKPNDETIHPVTYVFKNLIRFSTDIPTDRNFTTDGILQAQCEKNGEGYNAKLVFEMENTVWWMNLTFMDLEVHRTLGDWAG